MKLLYWLKKISVLIILFLIIDFGISQVLLVGINKYFGLHQNAPIMVNGSSMVIAGFNKSEIEKKTNNQVALYARNGVSLADRSAMLNHYFNTTTKKTEIAILEVNPLLFSNRFTAANVYLLFLPFMDDNAMNDFIKSKTSVKEFWTRKIVRTSRFNLDLISASIKGYLGVYDNKKEQKLNVKVLESLKKYKNTVPVELHEEKYNLFLNTLNLTKEHSNHVILVNMPIFSGKKETFNLTEYNRYLQKLDTIVNNDKNIYLLDLNQSELIDNPDLFSDPLHLNVNGQKEATSILTNFIIEKNLIKTLK